MKARAKLDLMYVLLFMLGVTLFSIGVVGEHLTSNHTKEVSSEN